MMAECTGCKKNKIDLTINHPDTSTNEITKENPVAKDLKPRIENDFTYHRPPAEVAVDFVTLRNKAKELALLFLDLVPSGREQATALTRLEEAVFHANAGIARQFPAEVSAPVVEDKEAVQASADPADHLAKEPEVSEPVAQAEAAPAEGTDQPLVHPGRIVT